MQLVANIQMRLAKHVRFMISLKTNGPIFVTWNNRDITIRLLCQIAGTFMSLVVEILLMKLHQNLSNDLMVSLILVNKSGSNFNTLTSITCGLQETHLVLLLLTIQRFSSLVVTTVGYLIALISILKLMRSRE